MADPPPDSVHPRSCAEWRSWLEDHHTQDTGVWLISYKKATGQPRVEYDEAVEEALCFGWVDSKGNMLGDERSMLWLAPRRRGSGWSRPNKQRIERLLAAGLMAPAGLAKIEDGIGRGRGARGSARSSDGAGRRPGGARVLGCLSPLGQARHPGMDLQRETTRDARDTDRGDGPAGRRQHPRQSVAQIVRERRRGTLRVDMRAFPRTMQTDRDEHHDRRERKRCISWWMDTT